MQRVGDARTWREVQDFADDALRLGIDDLDPQRRVAHRLAGVYGLRSQHEGIDDGAAERLEHGVECRRGQPVLELELHPKIHARAARADRLETPFAGQIAERSVHTLHVNSRIQPQAIARGEFGLQYAARHFEGRYAFDGGNLLHACTDAPRQEFRIAGDIIHQSEHLCGRIGHQCAALDNLHSYSPAAPPLRPILRQKRGRRHRRIGRITCHALASVHEYYRTGPLRPRLELRGAHEMKTTEKLPPIAVNRKARFDYFIEERFEAGISLMGWEVKSMRAGKAQIAEAYVYLKGGEAFLFGAHINALNSASTHVDTDPTRTRKLLLNRRQLDHMVGAVERRGYTIVPLELYWKAGRAKLEIGLAKGKKQHDKRANEKDRHWQRDKGRIMKALRR